MHLGEFSLLVPLDMSLVSEGLELLTFEFPDGPAKLEVNIAVDVNYHLKQRVIRPPSAAVQ